MQLKRMEEISLRSEEMKKGGGGLVAGGVLILTDSDLPVPLSRL